MVSNRRNIIISFQLKNGGDAPLVFEITQSKMDKIVQIIQPEIDKKRQKEECSSVSLEQFFVDAKQLQKLQKDAEEFLEETKDSATLDPEDLEYEKLKDKIISGQVWKQKGWKEASS